MKQIIRSRILRKFLTLAFLIIGLAFVTSTNFTTPTAKAGGSCCEDCLPDYNVCLRFCNDPQTTYHGCETDCANAYSYCLNVCTHCE